MQKITPFLWFNDNAEEAVNYYASIFRRARIGHITRYDEAAAEASGQPAGAVMTVSFEIEGQEFVALNGGPHHTFSPAVSFVVNCETQDEIDELWEKLSAGGEAMQCGWLKDKFGVSWQVVPADLGELLWPSEPGKSERAMKALMQMRKIDIETLRRA